MNFDPGCVVLCGNINVYPSFLLHERFIFNGLVFSSESFQFDRFVSLAEAKRRAAWLHRHSLVLQDRFVHDEFLSNVDMKSIQREVGGVEPFPPGLSG